jgi:caffeoyl-CoA O-methyltransferase
MADPDSRKGVRYADPAILDWLDRVHAAHDHALATAFDAPEREGMPAIQVGPSEGRLLTLLMRMIGARRVVEVGTLAGYSAMRIARGLAPGGHLWTCELEAKHAAVARANLHAAGLADHVTIVEGAALETLPTLERHGPFDAVFVDADKGHYPEYGRWAMDHLRPGGLLLADNAYLFGELLDDSATALAMRRFHEEAAARLETVCISTPDGLLLGIKGP